MLNNGVTLKSGFGVVRSTSLKMALESLSTVSCSHSVAIWPYYPFVRYLASKNRETLKTGLGVVQAH